MKYSITSNFLSIYKYRELLYSLILREIDSKHKASILGRLWIIIYPLIMLGVYTFVFGGIFGARWGTKGDYTEFVPMLYCGLIIHALFAETVSKSPYLITSNPNYVKKVVFPLELLTVATFFASLFHSAVSFFLLIFMLLIIKHQISSNIIYVPIIIIPLTLFTLGFSWLICAFGTFFRDIEQIIAVAMSMLLYLSPVFYSIEAAPKMAQTLMLFNPLTYPIEDLRRVLLLGHSINWHSWIYNLLFSVLVCSIGSWLFDKVRPAFSDVV